MRCTETTGHSEQQAELYTPNRTTILTGLIFADSRSFLIMSEATEADLLDVRGCDLTTFETPFNSAGATAAANAVTIDDVGATASGRGFSSHDVVFADNKIV